ncbi:MAG: HAD family phosphatase [Deltaproteobacteria bacterium]|nr:HAD family phosphatase [Deltaproteobacteria bacterium]
MTLAAAIFDLDGTLVDTMPLHYEAYRRTFAEHGLALAEAAFYAHIGGVAAEAIPKFLLACGALTPPPPVAQLHARKKAHVAELIASTEIMVLPAADVLHLLAGRVPVALASSGARAGVEAILARLHWSALFDVVITGDETPRGKPAPDPFLLAAGKLGVAPADCLVFEDTNDGVAAARAAGMRVFDVRRAAAPERGHGPPPVPAA